MDIFVLLIGISVVIFLFIRWEAIFIDRQNFCVDCKHYVLTNGKHMCYKPLNKITKEVHPMECAKWRNGVDDCCDFKHKAGLLGAVKSLLGGEK